MDRGRAILGPDGWETRRGSFATDFNGPNRRIRVDNGQTGFFNGREFRTFRELNLADGASLVVKAVVPVDTIVHNLTTELISGQLKMETVVGGTEGGAFSETLPIIGRNTMTERPEPFYASQIVLTAGGTHTGGTILDVFYNKTAGNANFAASISANETDVRGVAPGTFYFRLSAVGATVGVFRAWWEERG